MHNEPFYSDGLRFECTGCSSCCRHEPGYVFLTNSDLKHLSAAKGISVDEFKKKYCRSVSIGGFYRLSLIEKQNFDCIFWDNGGCAVYSARPVQCSTFPFWSSNLGTQEDWDYISSQCPGANRGKLYSRKEIDEKLALRAAEPLLEGEL